MQNLFLQMYDRCLSSETSFHFIENQLITEFGKTVKTVINEQIENKMKRFIFKKQLENLLREET